jgi:hypothetical protein
MPSLGLNYGACRIELERYSSNNRDVRAPVTMVEHVLVGELRAASGPDRCDCGTIEQLATACVRGVTIDKPERICDL